MNLDDQQMPNQQAGYSEFSSAWYAMVYGGGDIRERLANALMRAIHVPRKELSPEQLTLFTGLRADRLVDRDANQIQDMVNSLNEAKIHELAETIAQLYFTTVSPDKT